MTWAPPILAALFAVATIVSLLRFRAGAKRGLRALHAALKARGIDYTRADSQGAPVGGDAALVDPLLGIVLQRNDGVRASLLFSNTHGAATVPGFASVDGRRIPPQRLLVELPLALPDQMICARERAAAVFGAFPPPAVTTGHPGFDQRFAVYLPKDESSGYRPEPADATPWARAASAAQLLANLDRLQFQALHVHEGRGRARGRLHRMPRGRHLPRQVQELRRLVHGPSRRGASGGRGRLETMAARVLRAAGSRNGRLDAGLARKKTARPRA